MLRRLRLQLTLLYILVALGLVALTGFGAYSFLKYYFQRETDLALQYKMAGEFRMYGLTPPDELQQAEAVWLGQQARPTPVFTPTSPAKTSENSNEEESDDDSVQAASEEEPEPSKHSDEERYDSQLASIFVLPVSVDGKVIASAGASLPPFELDEQASQAASVNGHDLRTVLQVNGSPVRLLTYRLSGPDGPFLLQIGRPLGDQARLLQQFLLGLLLVCTLSTILLGLGSWWLSGRSLGPAQRAWDQQHAFVSNASHELRTPLTLIRASAEVGQRSSSQGEQVELLGDILGEVDYMNHLVDDLLLLSRLDTRRLQMSREALSVKQLLEEIAHQAGKLVAEKNIRLETTTADGVVWGDPARLRQVLLILLDNAVRFTPPNGVISLESLQKGKTRQIIVRDSGRGIPPQHLPHVFERFYQAGPPGEAQTRSNGLGLSIAKGIVEAQGGRIRIESQVGKGTRVILEFPA